MVVIFNPGFGSRQTLINQSDNFHPHTSTPGEHKSNCSIWRRWAQIDRTMSNNPVFAVTGKTNSSTVHSHTRLLANARRAGSVLRLFPRMPRNHRGCVSPSGLFEAVSGRTRG